VPLAEALREKEWLELSFASERTREYCFTSVDKVG
jgi:hypothetical protein